MSFFQHVRVSRPQWPNCSLSIYFSFFSVHFLIKKLQDGFMVSFLSKFWWTSFQIIFILSIMRGHKPWVPSYGNNWSHWWWTWSSVCPEPAFKTTQNIQPETTDPNYWTPSSNFSWTTTRTKSISTFSINDSVQSLGEILSPGSQGAMGWWSASRTANHGISWWVKTLISYQ